MYHTPPGLEYALAVTGAWKKDDTMIELPLTPEQVQKRKTAKKAGADAFDAGLTYASNPYKPWDIEYNSWKAGWDSAKAQNEPIVVDQNVLAEPVSVATEVADSAPTTTSPRETPSGHHALFDYEVKSWPWLFGPMIAGQKTHDMRDKRDRDYSVGDRMLLREYDPRDGTYTGREAVADITYITDNVTPCAMSSTALSRDHAILSVRVSELGDTDRNA